MCVSRFLPWNIHLTWTWRRNGWKLCSLSCFFFWVLVFFCHKVFSSLRCTNMILMPGTVLRANIKSSNIITLHCVKLISSICHIFFLAPLYFQLFFFFIDFGPSLWYILIGAKCKKKVPMEILFHWIEFNVSFDMWLKKKTHNKIIITWKSRI